MNNKVRLTKKQLHRVIKESVEKVLNESVKAGDMKNVVPQSIAKKFGFKPEYRIGNGIELWNANLKQIKYNPEELLRLLGISRFTSYNINGNVRITVKREKKMNYYTKSNPYNDNDWKKKYRDDRGFKFSSKGSGANKQWKRENKFDDDNETILSVNGWGY